MNLIKMKIVCDTKHTTKVLKSQFTGSRADHGGRQAVLQI